MMPLTLQTWTSQDNEVRPQVGFDQVQPNFPGILLGLHKWTIIWQQRLNDHHYQCKE